MHIHYLQHVPFEDPAQLLDILHARHCTLSGTHLYAGEQLPARDSFDALVVMGGPMGVHDDDHYPWLGREKAFLRHVLTETRKPVLGICLGAQLIAHCLGATVRASGRREIGWHAITLSPEWLASPWAQATGPGPLMAFHWHGDTFELPAGALALGSTPACANQGFVVDDRIIGLQCHLETTVKSATALIHHCGNELDGSRWVQDERAILSAPHFHSAHQVLAALVDTWLAGH